MSSLNPKTVDVWCNALCVVAGFDLGKMQVTGEPCHNVVLPAWAKTPEDFIHKHRLALVCCISQIFVQHFWQFGPFCSDVCCCGERPQNAITV